MSWLTKIALKRRWLTFLLVALISGASIWGTLTLKAELLPNIELPMTTVVTVYPQASPEEVMNRVTTPVEGVFSDLPGLKHLLSSSLDGMSLVLAQFEYGTDMDRVNSTLRQRLKLLAPELPPEVSQLPQKSREIEENPLVFPIDINMMPVVELALTGNLPPAELKAIALEQIVPRLKMAPGVYDVAVEGGDRPSVLISPDPQKLVQSHISTSQLLYVLTKGKFKSLAQLEAAPLGGGVSLGKVAQVGFGLPPGSGISRFNGQPCVTISVWKNSQANTVKVARAVLEEAGGIRLGKGLKLVKALDQSELIERSLSHLKRDVITGMLLAVAVVFLFLLAFRASLILAVSIPLSVLIGFLCLRATGITLNILTLSAMSIAVGRLIDDSIVVLEAIYRRLQQGKDFGEAAIGGVREVGSAIASCTLATVVIFVPLFFVGGLVGQLFVPFGLTIIFALLASLLIAITLVPALSGFLHPRKRKELLEGAPGNWYQRFYLHLLRWTLGHRALTLGIAAVLFLGSLLLIPAVGTSFIPSTSEKLVQADVTLPPGSSVEETCGVAKKVESFLGQDPEVRRYRTIAGVSRSILGGIKALTGGGSNTATVIAYLDPKSDMNQKASELQAYCSQIKGARIKVVTGQALAGEMTSSGLSIFIQGDNFESLAQATHKLMGELQQMQGVTNLEAKFASFEPKLDFEPDVAKLVSLGLRPEELKQLKGQLFLVMHGGKVGQANLGGEDYALFLQGLATKLKDPQTAQGLLVGWPTPIPLGEVAKIRLAERPNNIQRVDGRLASWISGNITAKDVGKTIRLIGQKIDRLNVPGVQAKLGGIKEEMELSFGKMYVSIGVAILLAYLVMALFLRSFLDPLVILVSLPLASIGAVLALLISGRPLDLSGLMGLLMLVGIVLTNAIVLLSLVGDLRRSGWNTHEALLEGGRIRLRPILMTAFTTMIAMVPLALESEESILMGATLGVVVIGGLFSSTLLTLLVIPVVYSLADRLRHR